MCRRSARLIGLEVSDWIHLHLVGLDELEVLLELIGREVLARSVVNTPPEGTGAGTAIELDDAGSVRVATIWVFKA